MTSSLFSCTLCSITVLEGEVREVPVIPWRPLLHHSLRSKVSSLEQQKKRIHAQDVLSWDPDTQDQRAPVGCSWQQREWRAIFFYLCTWKPFHCMGILDCFSCMLSGHILYGYFVLLMVNWKRKFCGKKWKIIFLCCSQSFDSSKCFLNQSRYVFLNGVSVCHSMLLRIECQFPFLICTLPQRMRVFWCGRVQDVLCFLFEMLCGFCHKMSWWWIVYRLCK